MSDVYKPYRISASDLKLANKGFSDKEKDLVRAFFRRFTNLLDDRPKVRLINAPQ